MDTYPLTQIRDFRPAQSVNLGNNEVERSSGSRCPSRSQSPPQLAMPLSLQLPHCENWLPVSGSGEFLLSIVPEASSANIYHRASSVRSDGYVCRPRPRSGKAYRTQKSGPHASSRAVLRVVDWRIDSPCQVSRAGQRFWTGTPRFLLVQRVGTFQCWSEARVGHSAGLRLCRFVPAIVLVLHRCKGHSTRVRHPMG
jgi:hypothetical protein